MSKRPEYITCISTGEGWGHAWCGREPDEFMFVDVRHALLSAANEGRFVPCLKCVEKWGGNEAG